MPRIPQRKFDFDLWAALARNDPERFEALRRDCVNEVIRQSAPQHRSRLRGIQFRIDMERRRSSSPMGACVRIQSLMWDSVLGPDGFYERLLRFVGRQGDAAAGGKPGSAPANAISIANPANREQTPVPPHCAKIIPFPAPVKSSPK